MTSGAHPAQQFEGAERLRDVMRGLRALPDDQRRALVARELEGRSYQEISDELGASHGGVRQLIFRARTTLRSTAAALLPLREWCWWLGAPRPGVGREAVVALAGAAAMGGVVVPDALRPPGAPPAVRREARTPSSSPSADPSGRERSSAPRAGARRPGPAVRVMAAPQGATPPRVRVAPGPVASVPRSPRRAIVGRVAAPAPKGSSVAEAAPPAQSAPVAGAPAAERAAEPAAVAVAAVAPPVPAPSPSPGTGTPVPGGSGSGTPGSGSGTSGSSSGSGTSGSGKDRDRDRDDDDDDEERDDRDERDERDERDQRDD
jgi:hypothetical protein